MCQSRKEETFEGKSLDGRVVRKYLTSVRDQTVSGEGGERGTGNGEWSFPSPERRFTRVWCAEFDKASQHHLESPEAGGANSRRSSSCGLTRIHVIYSKPKVKCDRFIPIIPIDIRVGHNPDN